MKIYVQIPFEGEEESKRAREIASKVSDLIESEFGPCEVDGVENNEEVLEYTVE